MEQKISLAGRDFVRLGEASIEHDIEFMRLLTAAGLDAPAIRSGEGGDEYGLRILKQLLEAQALLPLVACLIIPADVVVDPGWFVRVLDRLHMVRVRPSGWTPEVAAETVRFLGDLDEPADKQKVWGVVGDMLVPFLKDGLAPWAASRRSLIPPMEVGVIVEKLPGGVISASGVR